MHDFKAISEEYDTPLPEAEPIPDDVQIPYEAALGGRVSHYHDYEEPPAYGEPNHLTIELPRSAFTDMALENLKRLVESKSALIKKALGTDCTPSLRVKKLSVFLGFKVSLPPMRSKPTPICDCACEMAKTQQRVNATEKQVENEKYARCFLLRLGFIGSEYKEERKILLSQLTGSSAFKSGTKSEVSNDAQ